MAYSILMVSFYAQIRWADLGQEWIIPFPGRPHWAVKAHLIAAMQIVYAPGANSPNAKIFCPNFPCQTQNSKVWAHRNLSFNLESNKQKISVNFDKNIRFTMSQDTSKLAEKM